LAAAERDKRTDRVKLTKEHIATLEKRLSYLTIELAPEGIGTTDFTLTRDGATVARAALGTASAVDPGKHVLNVSATGFTTQIINVEVGPDGDRKKVVIPSLVRIMEKPVEPPPVEKPIEKPLEKTIEVPKPVEKPVVDESNRGMHPGRIGALIFGGISAIALGSGAVFGLQAKSQHDEALRLCPASPCPNEKGILQNESAKKNAALSTGFVAGGLVGLAGSVALWVAFPNSASRPKTASHAVSIFPVIAPGNAGAFIMGSF
jgi:hypothetical protein